MKCSFGISDFLEEISSLSHSVVFLYFFAVIAEEGFLISSCYSLELCIQMLIIFPLLLCFLLLFFSQLFGRPPQTAILLFCISFPWGWSWSLSLATSCEELTHWERLWYWEGLGVGGEGDNRGWDGRMASLTRWTWVSVNSGSWWWTGRPGVLRFMGSQRVRHDWATELNWTET